MSFYQLSKSQRIQVVQQIHDDLLNDFKAAGNNHILTYFDDEDTYIRKSAYLQVGKIWLAFPGLQPLMLQHLEALLQHKGYRVRQTVINAAGEIGKKDFECVRSFFDRGLFDEHHSPRNAVIGSIKKMGEINPGPVLNWAKEYLHHSDKEVRREICHGIELRGRKHPSDILPMLKELEFDKTARVRTTLVHVLGQIAYKKGCLQIVVEHLKQWENTQLVRDALEEIIDVHDRYKNFAVFTQEEARKYIAEYF